MSRQRLTVVLSQAQGKDPRKRALEESVAAALLMEPGLDVSIVPYLYDLDADHTGRLFLESVTGDMVVLGWMYPRAAFWLLDRCDIKGHYGENQITPKAEADDDEERRRAGTAEGRRRRQRTGSLDLLPRPARPRRPCGLRRGSPAHRRGVPGAARVAASRRPTATRPLCSSAFSRRRKRRPGRRSSPPNS